MILLDTHVVVWMAYDPGRVSPRASKAIQAVRDSGGGLYISAVSLYELAIIVARGRIETALSPQAFLAEVTNRLIVQDVSPPIASTAATMPKAYPRDPMDRIIGATALVERMELVTADERIRQSKAVPTIW